MYVEERWTHPRDLIGELYEMEPSNPAPGMGAKMVGVDMANPFTIMQTISAHQRQMRARQLG